MTDLIENRKKRDFIRLVKRKNCRLICRDYKMAIMRSALNLCVATSCKLEESLGEAPILTPIENLIYIADLDVARVQGKESKLVTSGRAGKACSSISQSNEHGVSRSRGRKRMLIKSITPSFVVGEVER